MRQVPLRRVGGAGVVLAGVWLAGCAGERSARFGVVTGDDLQIGHYAPDFSFVGEDAKVETFGQVREVVTLVAFPDEPAWPDCSRCGEIVRLAGAVSTSHTPVSVVSIVTPARGEKECAAALHRCSVKSRSPLIALHDHTGRVRALYGSQVAGKYYIVNWTGRIAATGPLSDRAGMEKALRDAVQRHEKHWDEVTRPPLDY